MSLQPIQSLRPRTPRSAVRRLFLSGCALLLAFGAMPFVNYNGESSEALGAVTKLAPGTPVTDVRVTPEATFDLPGPPFGLTFRGAHDGYIAFGSGQIAHFNLTGSKISIRTVASGLSQPRGIVFHDGRIFVSDIKVPCGKASGFTRCSERDFPETWPLLAQQQILREGRGRVLSFSVEEDGDLSNETVIVDELPVATSDHAANGLAFGTDGFLYLAIGNVDSLYNRMDLVEALHVRRTQYLGSIVRFRPDGSGLERFANGIRNVYGLTFDEKGALYGVDNDGPTQRGYRGEEVIHFRRTANYGYPTDGSYGPFSIATDGPVWILRSNGSAGIASASSLGVPPGLVIGSCGQLTYLRLRPEIGDKPWSRNDEQLLSKTQGCSPSVVSGPDKRLYVGSVFPNTLTIYRATSGNLAAKD